MFILTPFLYFLCRNLFGFSLVPLITHFWSFFVISNIFSFSFSAYLFIDGKLSKSPSFENTSFLPNWIFEAWCGLELNPTILGVDLKMFFYQPSLIGLHMIALAFAEIQYTALTYLTT